MIVNLDFAHMMCHAKDGVASVFGAKVNMLVPNVMPGKCERDEKGRVVQINELLLVVSDE